MTKQPTATRLLGTAAIAAVLGLISAPSFAGNYAEGDPRPVATTSSTTRAAVAADAKQWLEAAPTQGYTDGISQQAEVVAANTRAAVAADTRLWLRSGLAARQNGEAGADATQPGYRLAAANYMSGQAAAQAQAQPRTTVR
ncbi:MULTISPECIES: hypothetical protein [unclassified Variovorax]|uniref:hypothetical protein n=1 Tax=unclassified Variovorax TaxID=663243 RepID=UPI003F4602DF